MNTGKLYLILGLTLLAILAACNPSSSSNNQGISIGSGNCANPLFPIVAGATWEYSSTGSPIGSYTYTQTITEVSTEGFTLSSTYQDVNVSHAWSCQGGDLTVLEAGGGTAATLSTSSGTNAQFQTDNVTGITLPSSVAPGSTWSQVFDISGEVNLTESQIGTAIGTFSSNYTAASTETVTVPAGTFNAVRIDVDVQYEITVSVQGITVPTTIEGTMIMWYAPGVGCVKIEAQQVEFGSETIELVQYQIP